MYICDLGKKRKGYMIFLILCIIINGFIGVIFKYFGIYKVNILHAILINYAVCVVCGSIYINDFSYLLKLHSYSWMPIAAVLGLSFIIVFNAYAQAVQRAGVGLATIFQKMSLIAPVILALAIYGDAFTLWKAAGIVLAILALVLLSLRKEKSVEIGSSLWILLLVFFGSCFIDVMLYLAEVEALAPNADVRFVCSIFLFALIFGLIFLVYNTIKEGRMDFEFKSLWAGFALGLPNFFSIYFLLLVISLGWEGSFVFPANNVGVLSIAAIAGVILFKEEITKRKLLGFAAAVSSILLLAIK